MFKQLIIAFFILLFPVASYYYVDLSAGKATHADEIEQRLRGTLSTANLLLKQTEQELREGKFNAYKKYKEPYHVFVYQRSKPYYWSTVNVEISSRSIFLESKRQFLAENDFGKFIVLKGGALHYTVVIVIPLERSYSIHNRFLKDHLTDAIFPNIEGSVFFEPEEGTRLIKVNEEIAFHLREQEQLTDESIVMNWLLAFAVWAMLLIAFMRYADMGDGHKLLLLIAVRTMLWFFTPPFSEHLLFTPSTFASSVLQANLFQYLLNLVLLVYTASWLLKSGVMRRFRSVAGFVTLFMMMLMIHDLVKHSILSITPFQILNFDPVTMVLLTALIMTCLSFGVLLIRSFLVEKWKKTDALLPALISLALIWLVGSGLAFSYAMGCVVLLGVEWIRGRNSILLPGYLLMCIAFYITFLNISKQQTLRFNKKISLSNMLVSGDDPYMEYLINEVSDRIADDRIITSKLKSPLISSDRFVRDKVKKVYLSKYFSGYEWNVDIVSIDRIMRNGDALEISGDKYDVIRKDGQDLYQFVNQGLAQNDYIKLVCFDDRPLIKNIVITLKGKNNPDYSVIPQLLLEGEAGAKDMDYGEFNYAVMRNDNIVLRHGDYYSKLPESNLKNLLASDVQQSDGYEHFRITREDESLIISNRAFGLGDWLNAFSLISILLALTFLLYFGIRLLVGQTPIMLTDKLQLTFGVIVIITFVSLLVVSVGALNQSYSLQIEEEHLEKAERVGKTITADLVHSQIDKEALERNLNLLARNNQADIHLYNNEGRLLSTTLPELFEKNLKSTLLQYDVLNSTGKRLLNERIGGFDFYSAYYPIYNAEKKRLGYINIPFFDAREALKERINTVSYLTLNISFGLLCLLLFISLWVSQRITRPILALSNKLDQLDLEKGEPLRWERNDEIGKLVESYNHMLINLNKSREALKKQEKEAAWKEMARQVAHEVKNPLTPMKLSLQFLMRKLSGDRIDPEEVKRTSQSMIEQIDNLSSIVESFSEFASMPEFKMEKTNIVPIVQDVANLHRHTAVIEQDPFLREYVVKCDGKALHAILSNIIINGVQAVSDARPQIHITHKEEEGNIVLSIRDNGEGIPEDVADKVFIPNFSTKYSGSGIGLALAKKGVQEFGGQIWFDTIRGEGTTFHISLPLSK